MLQIYKDPQFIMVSLKPSIPHRSHPDFFFHCFSSSLGWNSRGFKI